MDFNSVTLSYSLNGQNVSDSSQGLTANSTANSTEYIAVFNDNQFPLIKNTMGGMYYGITININPSTLVGVVTFKSTTQYIYTDITNINININIGGDNYSSYNITNKDITTTPSGVSPTVYVIQYNVNYNNSPTFSQGALSAGNNAATITTSFLRGLDPTKTTITDEETIEIGKSAGKAISHSVSTTEWIADALRKTTNAFF